MIPRISTFFSTLIATSISMSAASITFDGGGHDQAHFMTPNAATFTYDEPSATANATVVIDVILRNTLEETYTEPGVPHGLGFNFYFFTVEKSTDGGQNWQPLSASSALGVSYFDANGTTYYGEYRAVEADYSTSTAPLTIAYRITAGYLLGGGAMSAATHEFSVGPIEPHSTYNAHWTAGVTFSGFLNDNAAHLWTQVGTTWNVSDLTVTSFDATRDGGTTGAGGGSGSGTNGSLSFTNHNGQTGTNFVTSGGGGATTNITISAGGSGGTNVTLVTGTTTNVNTGTVTNVIAATAHPFSQWVEPSDQVAPLNNAIASLGTQSDRIGDNFHTFTTANAPRWAPDGLPQFPSHGIGEESTLPAIVSIGGRQLDFSVNFAPLDPVISVVRGMLKAGVFALGAFSGLRIIRMAIH